MFRKTFDACLANKEIEEGLIGVKERAGEFGVSGTPTFLINGKMSRGSFTFDQFKAMVEGKTS